MSRAASFAAKTAVPAMLSLALLGGCARAIFEEEPRGSIKDTPVASASPAGKAAPRRPRVRREAEPAAPRGPARAEMPAAPAAATARPAGPAPIAAGPAPIIVPAERPARDSSAGAAGPASEQAQAEASKRLLAEGDRLFQAGDVAKARERYLAAMNGPIPEVMLAFARSFDPYYLARLPRSNAAPDAQRAVTIYEGAVRQGAKDAEADLQRLRKSLATSPSGTPIRPVQPPSRALPETAPAATAPPAQEPPVQEPSAKQ